MATLRWWAQKVDRQNVIARSNAHYGIRERSFLIDGSKAKTIDKTDLDKVRDPHVRIKLELERAYGPRISTLFVSPDLIELTDVGHAFDDFASSTAKSCQRLLNNP